MLAFSNGRQKKDESNQDALISDKYPAGMQLFKVNNGDTRTICEICSKLTIKTPQHC